MPVIPTTGRPGGSPLFLVLILLVLLPSLILGNWLGAGGAAVLGAFIALFTLLGSLGGSLGADLKRACLIGMLIAFSAVAPRLVAQVSIPGAFALIVTIIFLSGLLPLLSRRNDAVALGLGMGTLFGYSLPISDVMSPWQIVTAGFIGFAVAILLRVLLGARDPHSPVRSAVARLYTDPSSDFGAALTSWLADRATQWIGTCLVAAGHYRLARRVLAALPVSGAEFADRLARADARAFEVSRAIETPAAQTSPPSLATDAEHSELPPIASRILGVAADAASVMDAALDCAATAAAQRDPRLAELPQGLLREVHLAAIRAGLRHGSIQVRHALRTAVAVLLALLVSLLLPSGDPLLPTLLVTAFALVQISWRATLLRARARLIGIAVGGALVAVFLIVLPPDWFLPMSLVGLAVGMWFILTRPAISIAAMLVMSVGLNTGLRHMDPVGVVTQYLALALTAVMIGGVMGFVIIPAWRPKSLPVRVICAESQIAAILNQLAQPDSTDLPKTHVQRLERACAATQQLTVDRERLDRAQQADLQQLQEALEALLIVAFLVAAQPSPDTEVALRGASQILTGSATLQSANFQSPPLQPTIDEPVPGRPAVGDPSTGASISEKSIEELRTRWRTILPNQDIASALLLLAASAHDLRTALLASLGADSPAPRDDHAV